MDLGRLAGCGPRPLLLPLARWASPRSSLTPLSMCKTNKAVLELYKAYYLEELERLFNTQSILMEESESRFNSMACHCGSSNKGKGREVIEVEEAVPNVLALGAEVC